MRVDVCSGKSFTSLIHVLFRAVGRPENPGVPISYGVGIICPPGRYRVTWSAKFWGCHAPPLGRHPCFCCTIVANVVPWLPCSFQMSLMPLFCPFGYLSTFFVTFWPLTTLFSVAPFCCKWGFMICGPCSSQKFMMPPFCHLGYILFFVILASFRLFLTLFGPYLIFFCTIVENVILCSVDFALLRSF